MPSTRIRIKKTQRHAPGEIVFAKLRGYPWWPAKIQDETKIPKNVMETKKRKKPCADACTLFFFGSLDYAFISEKLIRPFDHELVRKGILDGKFKNKDLMVALEQALNPNGLDFFFNPQNLEVKKQQSHTTNNNKSRTSPATEPVPAAATTAIKHDTNTFTSSKPKEALSSKKKTLKRALDIDADDTDKKKRPKPASSVKGTKKRPNKVNNSTGQSRPLLYTSKSLEAACQKSPEYERHFKHIYIMRHKLQKLMYGKKPGGIPLNDYPKISAILTDIEKYDMTKELLKETQIGKIVRCGCDYQFDTNNNTDNLRERCLGIMQTWATTLLDLSEHHHRIKTTKMPPPLPPAVKTVSFAPPPPIVKVAFSASTSSSTPSSSSSSGANRVSLSLRKNRKTLNNDKAPLAKQQHQDIDCGTITPILNTHQINIKGKNKAVTDTSSSSKTIRENQINDNFKFPGVSSMVAEANEAQPEPEPMIDSMKITSTTPRRVVDNQLNHNNFISPPTTTSSSSKHHLITDNKNSNDFSIRGISKAAAPSSLIISKDEETPLTSIPPPIAIELLPMTTTPAPRPPAVVRRNDTLDYDKDEKSQISVPPIDNSNNLDVMDRETKHYSSRDETLQVSPHPMPPMDNNNSDKARGIEQYVSKDETTQVSTPVIPPTDNHNIDSKPLSPIVISTTTHLIGNVDIDGEIEQHISKDESPQISSSPILPIDNNVGCNRSSAITLTMTHSIGNESLDGDIGQHIRTTANEDETVSTSTPTRPIDDDDDDDDYIDVEEESEPSPTVITTTTLPNGNVNVDEEIEQHTSNTVNEDETLPTSTPALPIDDDDYIDVEEQTESSPTATQTHPIGNFAVEAHTPPKSTPSPVPHSTEVNIITENGTSTLSTNATYHRENDHQTSSSSLPSPNDPILPTTHTGSLESYPTAALITPQKEEKKVSAAIAPITIKESATSVYQNNKYAMIGDTSFTATQQRSHIDVFGGNRADDDDNMVTQKMISSGGEIRSQNQHSFGVDSSSTSTATTTDKPILLPQLLDDQHKNDKWWREQQQQQQQERLDN